MSNIVTLPSARQARFNRFKEFEDRQIWCARASGEDRRCDKTGEPFSDKAPLKLNGWPASTTDRAAWATRERAEKASRKRASRAGVMLGPQPDGRYLVGIDLDGAAEAAGRPLEPWAADVLDKTASAAERSLSGRGAHVYAFMSAEDVERLREAGLIGKAGRTFEAGDHTGIAFFVESKFFAVTEDWINDSPVRQVDFETVRWLLEDHGPAFKAEHGGANGGGDISGSGIGFKFLCDRRRDGMDESEMRDAIAADDGAAGEWWSRCGEHQQRRAVENAIERIDSENLLDEFENLDLHRKPKRGGWPLAELFGRVDVDIPFLVEGMVRDDGFALVTSKPKTGKSILTRHLALCIARGEPFLGRETRQGRTLLISFEDSEQTLAKSMQAMGAAETDDIRVFSPFDFDAAPEKRLKELETDIVETKPALIVIDTMGAFLAFTDGNDYAKMTNEMRKLQLLARKHRVCIVAVHHDRKMEGEFGDSVLGSTAVFAQVDTLINLQRTEGGDRTVSTVQREGEDLEKTLVRLGDDFRPYIAGPAATVRQQEIETRIADFVREHGPVRKQEITDNIDARVEDVRRTLNRMITRGGIERRGSGKAGSPYTYATPSTDFEEWL